MTKSVEFYLGWEISVYFHPTGLDYFYKDNRGYYAEF